MNWKATVFSVVTVITLAAGPAWAGCPADDKIDNTTADQAKHKILAAGYTNVADLKKGCDNYWHGVAVKDGATVDVNVSPSGEVMTEGN